jgi:hypothetical protein
LDGQVREAVEDPGDQAQSHESSWHDECFRLGLVLSGVLRVARGQLASQCVACVTPVMRAARPEAGSDTHLQRPT